MLGLVLCVMILNVAVSQLRDCDAWIRDRTVGSDCVCLVLPCGVEEQPMQLWAVSRGYEGVVMKTFWFLMVFMALGCEEAVSPSFEAYEYCATEKVLDGEGMHPCSNSLGNKEACRREHYKRCLRSYR